MFVMKFSTLTETEVIYSVTFENWLYYVGRCTLAQFPQLPDARWHPEMSKLLGTPEFAAGAVVTMLATGPAPTDRDHSFFDKHQDLIEAMKPTNRPAPRPKAHGGRKTRAVIHRQTGELFRSASEAAEHYQIKQSNMSRHLRGLLPHVSNHTFGYVDEN